MTRSCCCRRRITAHWFAAALFAAGCQDPSIDITRERAGRDDHDGAGQGQAGGPYSSTGSLLCEADPSARQVTDYSAAGPYTVATIDITFEDTSRPILQTQYHAAAPSRTLVTTIYYPADSGLVLPGFAPKAAKGPFPLLMYSHGYSSTRGEATTVATRAASHGYIVVSPDFPLSNLLANGGAPDGNDAPNQPGDISFLIDRVLELSRDPTHVLADAVDAKRIGATGVSMGGLTTLLVALHPRQQDARISAALPIAALSQFFLEGFYHTREMPLLFLQGDLDAFVDYKLNSRRAFERSTPNSLLVTLTAGSHAAFAVQFDRDTIAVLNALLGKPGSDPSNPDGFGCGAVSDTLNQETGSFPELGGRENFIDDDPSARLRPCSGDEYKHPAMDPSEQVALSATTVVAFFDAHLAAEAARRGDACHYLRYELPKHPDLALE